jgi:hypothetical protein
MMCRGGKIELEETLRRDTVMGELCGESTLSVIDHYLPLHKLDVKKTCRS